MSTSKIEKTKEKSDMSTMKTPPIVSQQEW